MSVQTINPAGDHARQSPSAPAGNPLNGQLGARERLEAYISRLPKDEWIQREPAELAQICGCSLRHLRRLFRQCFGVSLRAQQTEYRLHRASQLLMETDDKILSIAWAVGFRHLGLFSRMFKRRFRMTPSEWRAKFRQKEPPPPAAPEAVKAS
ncbi:helix-turn-helix transcriptional regulator [Fontisphaera persica]|uniref:helix-turn-helix transcriptional regulator n=1 Tax=Fontisphaera persica TaxID=2974023 RepID=UPI0024BFA473|nr:helix-turn-helix transcriptional regulator [Fontisphaera persica]WCJ58307.1 helix-turn-helix transcriptional regulator [Fontisphaera persica]